MSLKDWIKKIESTQLNEFATNAQVQIKPASQMPKAPGQQTIQPGQQTTQPGQANKDTQVITQGNKTLGTVDNAQLAQQIKQSIGKGEMTLAGDQDGLKETSVEEEVDTGQYDAAKSPSKDGDAAGWDKNFRERLKQYIKDLEKQDDAFVTEGTGYDDLENEYYYVIDTQTGEVVDGPFDNVGEVPLRLMGFDGGHKVKTGAELKGLSEDASSYTVYCSQCGGGFNRDKKEGYSHCKDHASNNQIDEDLPPPENARKTQIAGTLPTYKKAADILNKTGVQGKALDFGAGLGMGTAELGKDAHSYEPFPNKKFKPHFVDVTEIPDNSYHKIVNLNVLNVVPNTGEHKIRDSIVKNIGRVLAPGGVALITTRGKDVLTIKGTPGEEPTSMISKIGTYQKGFTQKELLQYIQQTLGKGFEVSSIKLGPAGVMIKKLDNQEVTEGYDTEELANNVYAEFERMYPNLARRANERTVHAAIMDVLNYGGDNDAGALAQDVARAVKQEIQQGLSEESEAKPVNMKRWLRDFERREDNNFHTENVLAMAQLVGTPEDVATMKQLVKQHRGFGLGEKQFEIRQTIADRLRPLVKQKIADSQTQGVAEGDNQFNRMMDKITSPSALNTREALAMMDELIHQAGATYSEALEQASMSYEIDRAKLDALYQHDGEDIAEGQQWPDNSNSLAKRRAVVTNLKGAPSKAGRGSGMTVATRVDPTITSTTVQRKDAERPIPSSLRVNEALDAILSNHPHEHKMCQEGWGMDNSLYEALCDHYFKEGRIPRSVWHGSAEGLRKHVEECYTQDTAMVVDEDVTDRIGDNLSPETDPAKQDSFNTPAYMRKQAALGSPHQDSIQEEMSELERSLKQSTEESTMYESKFTKLSKKLGKQAGITDPDALAASIGRKKLGQAEMTRRSKAARNEGIDEAVEKTKTGVKHTADAGGYGRRHSDDEDENGKKVKSTAPGKGRGRPKKDADETGEKKEYNFDAFSAFGAGKKPKKEIGKLTAKNRIKTKADSEELDESIAMWDKQLKGLLNEGLTVSTSVGNEDGQDSVSITANDADAHQLLQLLQNAGMGSGVPAHAVQAATAPSQVISKDTVQTTDGPATDDEVRNLAMPRGMAFSVNDDSEMPTEPEEFGTLGQEEVVSALSSEQGSADDSGDSALAAIKKLMGQHGASEVDASEAPKAEVSITQADSEIEESDEDGKKPDEDGDGVPDWADKKPGKDDSDEEDEDKKKVDEGHQHTCESCGEEMEDEHECGQLNEWSNSPQGQSDDEQFDADMKFMQDVITAGLNGKKSTGQATTPVLASQSNRQMSEGYNIDVAAEMKKLAGIK